VKFNISHQLLQHGGAALKHAKIEMLIASDPASSIDYFTRLSAKCYRRSFSQIRLIRQIPE